LDSDDILKGIGVSALVVLVIFVACLMGALVGAFTAWVVSLTPIGSWIIDGLSIFGFNAQGKLVEFGALLGFVSGFFRSSATTKTGIVREKD
jgi:hypothetical protein